MFSSLFQDIGGSTAASSPAATRGMAAGRSAAAQGSPDVQAALRHAADATGTDFTYLLDTARRESSLQPAARAPGSSATGLFQFLDGTWLQEVKEDGPALGLGAYADAIQRTAGGRYVADPAQRQAILDLRQDPDANALLAGALTQRNRVSLAASLGREPSTGELYVAHLMGAGGATQLIGLAARDAGADATQAFPVQAAANPGVFTNRDGSHRTAGEVYAALTAGPATPVPVAAAGMADQGDTSGGPRGGMEADTGTGAWLGVPAARAATSGAQPFAGLFRTEGAMPVSSYVAATWSNLGQAGGLLAANQAGGLPAANQDAAPIPAPASADPLTAAAVPATPTLSSTVLPLGKPQADMPDTGPQDAAPSGGLAAFLSGLFGGASPLPQQGRNWGT